MSALGGWRVERPDPEQPPRLVWWHDDHADAAVIDVFDLLYAIEVRTGTIDTLYGLAEQAITELADALDGQENAQ